MFLRQAEKAKGAKGILFQSFLEKNKGQHILSNIRTRPTFLYQHDELCSE